MLTEQTIDFFERKAEIALDISTGGVMKNTCDLVSIEFAHLVEEYEPYSVYAPVRADVNGSKHYVAVVDVTNVPQITDDVKYIIVDATIQQFNEEFPDVVIEPYESQTKYDFVKIDNYIN